MQAAKHVAAAATAVQAEMDTEQFVPTQQYILSRQQQGGNIMGYSAVHGFS